MSGKQHQNAFEPLPMRKRALAPFDANQYCIWATNGEIREIKADTAYQAVKSSGLTSIIKIERMFNTRKNILDKSKFVSETPVDVSEAEAERSHMRMKQESLRRRRNPIISADELDSLMRAFKNGGAADEAEAEESSSGSADIAGVAEQASSGSGLLAVEPPFVPLPEDPASTVTPASPIGLDVHGDGFDEIIPAAPAKPPVAKAARDETRAAAAPTELPPSAPPLPEKELSAEEVEKLLSGTPE